MKQRRENGRGHGGANSSVGVRGTVAFRVALKSLAVGGFGIFGLADQGDKADKWKRDRVEHAVRGELEFVFGRRC